jgi:GNAT superfamily N-acetyltransferase
MIELMSSPRESARFGLRIARASVDTLDAEDLVSALRREPIDVAILRLPSRAIGAIEDLRRYGLDPIIADTLVRYEIDLASRALSANVAEIVLRPATSNDAHLLETMAREIFAGYKSHYHANPRFPPDKILDGYAEWATSHLDSREDDIGAWIVERDGQVVGFSCYRLDADAGLAIGVLNGVLPDARGKGNYRAMLQHMLDHFSELGAQRFSIATQDHNMTVQRTWVSEGLALGDVSNTVHVNMPRAAKAVLEAGSRQASSSR